MPQLVSLSVERPRRRPIRLWIPLVPVLLVFSPVLALASIVGAVGCVVYRVNPVRALLRGWALFCATRGIRINVQQGRQTVSLAIR